MVSCGGATERGWSSFAVGEGTFATRNFNPGKSRWYFVGPMANTGPSAVGCSVKLRSHLSQRQIRLGSKEQRKKPDRQGKLTVDKPHTDGDRHERHR